MPRKSCSISAKIVAAACLALAGCADGMLPELRPLNPWVRQEWAKDEQEIATYHRRVSDLAALRSQASSLPPDQRQQIAGELVQRLKDDQSPVMRSELVRTLGEFPIPAAHDAVLAAMTDESGHVRVAAVKALGRRPTTQGREALSRAVADDSDLDVRIAAARELGKFRDEATPQALRPALDENDPALQLAAMQSLQALTGRTEYGKSVPTWRDYLDGNDPAPPPGPSLAEQLRQFWNWY